MKQQKIKKTIAVLFAASLIALSLHAQVTIGSGIEPTKGALLDIKNKNASVDGGATTGTNGGGILMPRVELVSLTGLEPFISTGDQTDPLKANLKGLIVYNLTTTSDFVPGLYVWDGTQWCDPSHIDESNDFPTVTNGLTYNTTESTLKLGGSLTENTTITTQSSNRLTISGSGGLLIDQTAPLYITSGSPGEGKVLTSDASGYASWGSTVPTAHSGDYPYGSNVPRVYIAHRAEQVSSGVSHAKSYAKYSINVPPGNSIVYAGFRVRNLSAGTGYITFMLSGSSTAFSELPVSGGTLNCRPLYAGFNLQPSNYNLGQTTFYVTNNTGSAKMVYVWGVTDSTVGNNDTLLMQNVYIDPDSGENFIVCAY